MRYAIVSDIHANEPAWNAVLLDIRSADIDEIVCLGDIVGYGPRPAQVLQSAYANVHHFVLGNHDAVICGKMDPGLFNEQARELILWTRERLSDDAIDFLRTLPLSLQGQHFRCAHGDFSDPAAFHYVIDPADAAASWEAVPEPLLFVGHTHEPSVFLLSDSGTPRACEPDDVPVTGRHRLLVNPGSVGLPRDRDARSCYVIYDTHKRRLQWRRVPFDIDAYGQDVSRAGLPPELTEYLLFDPRRAVPPLREELNFSPPTSPEDAVHDAVEVQTLHALRRRVWIWRLLTAAALAAGLAALLAALLFWRRPAAAPPLVLRDPTMVALPAHTVAVDADVLPSPNRTVAAGKPIPDWEVRLGDGERQSVAVEPLPADAMTPAGAFGFRLASASPRAEVVLSSPPIRVSPGMRFQVRGLFRHGADFSGTVAVHLAALSRSSAAEEDALFLVKPPVWQRRDDWYMAQATSDAVPEGVAAVRLQVRGRFQGRVLVQGLRLIRRD